MLAAYLDTKIKKIAPIYGIRIGAIDNKNTWQIQFRESANDQQELLAQQFLDDFDYEQYEQQEKENKKELALQRLKASSNQDIIDLLELIT